MAVYYNLKGTTQSEFQIGKAGPTLTNASGSLAIGTAGATTTLSAPDNADLILVAGPATTGNPGGDLILRAGDGTAGTGDGAITIDRGKLVTKAPTTTYAGFNLPPGTSPSSPVNGDLWLTSSHALNFRVNGVTIDLLSPEQVTVNANTSTDPSIYPLLVPSSATGPQSALIDNANFWYDASANILTATGGFEGNVYTITADGYIIFDEHTTAPGTPAAGTVAVYAKADGKIYRKDDTGTETELGGGAGASVTISDTAPGSPTAGDLWWESDTGILKVYYDDGTSSQWVDASPVPAPNAGITVEAKSTSFNAAVNYRYMITGNSVTATLPSSASLGDTIYFVAGTSTITGFTVGRNGLNIMGLAENMTVGDNTNFAFGLVYNDATNGWRLI